MEIEVEKILFIESLADVLANSHDWLTHDPVAEIAAVMIQNHPGLEKKLAVFVAQRFISLPLSKRLLSDLNHVAFVRDSIREFISN